MSSIDPGVNLMSHVQSPGAVAPDLRNRATARRLRIETQLEAPATHGCGEVLDVTLWGTVARSRAPAEIRAVDALRDLVAVACMALPSAGGGLCVEPLPFERALFGSSSEGPDEVRLRFRVVGSDHEQLTAWRAALQDNLGALGVRHGAC